ncbi:MAG: site-specific DNA-methyltransferase [Anaerolineales bacterium]|nr:site-specific DNA-methyltransferase [Anaerolineales bacterium]
MTTEIIPSDCEKFLSEYTGQEFDLSFLDPPFNQDKEYDFFNDNMPPEQYWAWMSKICRMIFDKSSPGASIYFMQREKNTHEVLDVLYNTGWTFQNLIIWKKKTSAVPQNSRYGKHYQVIAFATKGKSPRVFNKLRIDPPLLATEKIRRPNGVYITDVWDDIRELTSGYFAGDEPLRNGDGERFHKQQSPIRLLTRIILSSSKANDLVFDPFAGTGTTLVVASQLGRHSIGTEIDPKNIKEIHERLKAVRKSDNVENIYKEYTYTENLDEIWNGSRNTQTAAPKPNHQYQIPFDNTTNSENI